MELGIVLGDMFEKMPLLVCVANPNNGRIIYKNKIAAELLGGAQTLDESPLQMEGPAPETALGGEQRQEMIYNKVIGGKWFRVTRYPIAWVDGSPAVMFTGLDFSDTRGAECGLSSGLYTDSMTGIYNRQYALESISQHIKQLNRDDYFFTVAYLDLDDLKVINDTYGHPEGDHYILTVVDVIKNATRESDIFARLGGDEFLLLFPKCPRHVVSNIMENVNHRLAVEAANFNKDAHYSVSCGIYEVRKSVGGRATTVEDILKTVDEKMYEMKKEYRKQKATRIGAV